MKAELFRRVVQLGMIAAVGIGAAGEAASAEYPTRPLRIIVGNTPGSIVDSIARKLGEGLGSRLGQPVVIHNQPGAGGLLGSQTIAKSPNDGYTLGFYGNTAVIVPHLTKNITYDPIQDITTIAIVGKSPFVAVVPQGSQVKDIRQLIEVAKHVPNRTTMGSAGAGTAIHLAGMRFQALTGLEMLHVPYKGVAPMQTALMAGEVDVAFPALGSVVPFIEQGSVRALGVTGTQRSPLLPNVPTIAEAGVPGYAFESWLAMVAPAGVPAEIIQKLNDEIKKVVAQEDVQQLFANNGIALDVLAPEVSQKTVADDYQSMGELVGKSGLLAN